MVVAFTGHRPNKVGGYIVPNPRYRWITFEMEQALLSLEPHFVISGMALGVDQWAAELAIKMHIPFIAAVPCKGQDLLWPRESQEKYKMLLSKATEIVYVSHDPYKMEMMQKRNEWMVDHCNTLVAVWDGTPGGTGNCVKYAIEKGTHIVYIKP